MSETNDSSASGTVSTTTASTTVTDDGLQFIRAERAMPQEHGADIIFRLIGAAESIPALRVRGHRMGQLRLDDTIKTSL